MEHPIILYDGLCPLCNRWVRWVLEQDRDGIFHFAPIQGRVAEEILARHALDPAGLQTLVLHDGGQVYVRSDALLRVLQITEWPLKALSYGHYIPRFLRDWVYDRIARNRFRWTAPLTDCPLPPREFRDRFPN
jgi:predicted DCC family thiol-disulfide oxidoreductase YuxK